MKDADIYKIVEAVSERLGTRIDNNFISLHEQMDKCYKGNCQPLKENFIKHEAGHSFNAVKLLGSALAGGLTTAATLVAIAKYWN